MNRKSIVVAMALSAAIILEAQQRTASPLAGPSVGVVHCPDGSLRVVYGLPANLIYGAMLGRGVNAAAFSNSSGLVSRAGEIDYLSGDGAQISSYPTDEPSPLLS